jgi:hypothetical protein
MSSGECRVLRKQNLHREHMLVPPLNIASFPSSNQKMQFQQRPQPIYKFVTFKVSQQPELVDQTRISTAIG